MIENNLIKRVQLENYKSIKNLDIELTNLNVLIGSNGSGKSNFIGFFSFLQQMIKGNLHGYVMDKGGQDTFLCYGRKESQYLNIKIDIAKNGYEFKLIPTNTDMFRVDKELYSYYPSNGTFNNSLNSGDEALIACSDTHYAKHGRKHFSKVQVFHFHDTSDESPLRSNVDNNDNLYLRSNGQNLSAMIKLVYDKHHEYYQMIVDTVRMVVPDFHDFVIRDSNTLSLEWFNKNNVDIPWRSHYLSDGSSLYHG